MHQHASEYIYLDKAKRVYDGLFQKIIISDWKKKAITLTKSWIPATRLIIQLFKIYWRGEIQPAYEVIHVNSILVVNSWNTRNQIGLLILSWHIWM